MKKMNASSVTSSSSKTNNDDGKGNIKNIDASTTLPPALGRGGAAVDSSIASSRQQSSLATTTTTNHSVPGNTYVIERATTTAALGSASDDTSPAAGGCFGGDGGIWSHCHPPSSTSTLPRSAAKATTKDDDITTTTTKEIRHASTEVEAPLRKKPQPPKKLAEVEELLSQDLAELSVAEKRRLDEEVHGENLTVYNETEELVAQSIRDMDEEIRKIRLRSCYDRAKFLAPHIVNAQEFKLMFLRSVEFEPRKAAQLIVKYYDMKQKLWGEDRLSNRITLQDFDEDDMEAFQSGAFQVLPCPDIHGRRITFFNKRRYKYKSVWNLVRRNLTSCFGSHSLRSRCY